jgi:hypothetical protein
MEQSQARKLTFPEVVRRLLDAGVESYFCDLAIRQETFYMRDLKTPLQKMTPPTAFVAEEFLVSGAHCSDSWRSGRHHSLSRIFQALRRCRVIAYWALGRSCTSAAGAKFTLRSLDDRNSKSRLRRSWAR